MNTERVSYGYIEQTCPILDALERTCLQLIQKDIDDQFMDLLDQSQLTELGDKIEHRVSILVGKIKELATEPFRMALMDCCGEMFSFEKERDKAIDRVEQLEYEVESVEKDRDYYHDLYEELLNSKD